MLRPSLLVATALATTSNLAWASEPSAETKAAARDLATEGIALAQKGSCEEAIPKLERADKLYHAPTILAWLGECQVKVGQLVAGTESLRRVVREELPAGSPAAYRKAQERAAKVLEEATPKIARLTISVSPSDVPGLSVTIDDTAVAEELVGVARPTDPGAHRVRVTAPGYLEATSEVSLAEGAEQSLDLHLVLDPAAAKAPEPEPAIAAPPAEPPKAPEPAPVSSEPPITRTLGWVGIGTGAALIVGGGVTGFLAMQNAGALDCPGGVCVGNQATRLNEANTEALLSTIFFSAGGALAVTGVVLVLTSGNPAAATGAIPHLQLGSVELTGGIGPGSAVLAGRF